MLLFDETYFIRTWQACFPPASGWRSKTLPDMPHNLWRSQDTDACAYISVSCTSTMDAAWRLSGKGRFPEWSWIAAGIQERGRGQAGRSWDSAAGNLFATIRLPDAALRSGTILSQAIGFVIAGVLKKHAPEPRVKWPNDILIGGKKVGGILIEERQGEIMAGIGLNITAVPEVKENKGTYRIPAGSLEEFGCAAEAPALWRSIVKELKKELMHILASPDELKRKTEQVLAFKGESVILERGTGENSLARILGLDIDGRLVVETPLGKETISSGRIIPRISI